MIAIVFLIFAFGMLISAFLLEGGQMLGLVGLTAFMIVFGGTVGATGVSIRGTNLKNVGTLLKIAFLGRKSEAKKNAEFLESISQKARRDGLLSLQDLRETGIDKFISDGIEFIVDGVDAEHLREILEIQAEQISARHKANISIFEAAGGYSPTMGIIGTVMGLVHVLSNLENAENLGASIAVAFLATLYGIAFANLIYLPVANKLKALNEAEMNEKYMIIEGLVAIAKMEPHHVIQAKLSEFIENKKDRQSLKK